MKQNYSTKAITAKEETPQSVITIPRKGCGYRTKDDDGWQDFPPATEAGRDAA